jgi:hypothetical protein
MQGHTAAAAHWGCIRDDFWFVFEFLDFENFETLHFKQTGTLTVSLLWSLHDRFHVDDWR